MIIKSEFTPAFGLSNSHLQTLLPTFIRNNLMFTGINQTLELNDGDFVDLVWTEKPISTEPTKPIVIVFHGLEGSIDSTYVKGMMLSIKKQGWIGLLMHFRGCSNKPNRLARGYHSGETGDAKQLLNWLYIHYPKHSLAAIGFSLGGNMLLKLQAELANASPFKAVVSVCAPILLSACADRLKNGFSKIYQTYLVGHLKNKLNIKAHQHNYVALINLTPHKIKQLKTFWQFDDLVTAPLHGFLGVDDYYEKSSALQYLKNIQSPSLIIQSLDDPFMTPDIIPDESQLSENITLELSDYGGHVGFIGGSILHPQYWLEDRVLEYCKHYF